jgi:beta-N-acetylhexosaminidase
MGRAYITGLHQGSNNQLLVVSKHFPGLGSSDRLPKDEVATVRKSLEQLKQIELAPFFAVTGLAETADETTDALLTSHIRYQGLQGNIRSTTRPVSLDQQALSLLLDLPALAEWRDNGGVMISDDVANRAVRSFYDPTGEEFNLRRSALDAFLAGNDLIYVGGLLTNPEPIDGEAPPTDGYAEILDTLNFFVQKYSEDPTFAERVDASVARILTIKYRLYGFFTLNLVLAPGDLEVAGSFEQTTFEVAQQAATLINPPLSELDNVLPNTPERNERIVFFTDTYDVRLCPDCEEQPIVPVDAMEQAILALYGPEAGGQVQASMLTSYSFADLEAMLDQKTDTELVEGNIRRAQWLVFFMLDVTPARAESLALRRFLSERPDLLREKSIVAFAANAPYYLDATDISKLTAYYALFSKPLPFFNVAARLLFKEIPVPQGDLPVSVPGVGYDLISATSPDPARVIPLFVDLPGEVFPESSEIPLDAATYTFALGDTIPIRTGTILDYNGNPVPSNTPVQFTVIVNGVEMPTIQTITNEGVASASVVVQQAGTIQIQADSGLATSNVLLIEIPEEVTTSEPSPSVTATDEPTPTASPTVPAPTPTPIVLIKAPPPTPGLGHWILAVMVAILIGWSANRAGALMGKTRWGIQWGLATFIGSMLAYIYAILELPGSSWAKNPPYFWGILIVVVMGGVIGWGIMAAFTAPKWQSGSKTAAPPKSRS